MQMQENTELNKQEQQDTNLNEQEQQLKRCLPVYYGRIFPHALFYKWLIYGDPYNFCRREISFTLEGNVYIRHQSFRTLEDFVDALLHDVPIRINIGAIYGSELATGPSGKPVEKELVFDIDLTEYDEIRTCCAGANVCSKCWKFMAVACKVLDASLKGDFGYKHRLWVFSGRRGVHCLVADEGARGLDADGRKLVADYVQLLRGGLHDRKVKLRGPRIHHSIVRALSIVDRYFLEMMEEHDILGTNSKVAMFLKLADESVRPKFAEALKTGGTSKERWAAFEETFQNLLRQGELPKNSKHLVEEIKLHYAYPRFDINVTLGVNHLLKSPFCVHPKTGKVCVPFDPAAVDSFDPGAVPTVQQLVDEIKECDVTVAEGPITAANSKTNYYEKTSLGKHAEIFVEFLRRLDEPNKDQHQKTIIDET